MDPDTGLPNTPGTTASSDGVVMVGALSNIASGWYQQVSNNNLAQQQMNIAQIQASTGQSTTALFGGMFGSGTGSASSAFSSPLVWLLIILGVVVMCFHK
jgi:hypothetical protein